MQNTKVTPEIARRIFSNAVSKGITVEVYLQTVTLNSLETNSNNKPPLSKLLEGLTGKIDSSKPTKKKNRQPLTVKP